jgi:serine/threonine protein phosphatase PrpC
LNVLTEYLEEGSTISVALVIENPSKVSIAILGDSPVVVYDQRGQFHVSPEHNVRSNLEERKKAEQRGGHVVYGFLYAAAEGHGIQLSRALGDAYMGNVISHEPEIYTIPDPQWVLVASDGLFDPAHEDAGSRLEEILPFARQSAPAEYLMNLAEKRGLRDNATAVVWHL